MGKFSAAKIFDALDQKLQKAMNYLIDLLETGYVVEFMLSGVKTKVVLDPKVGLAFYQNGVYRGGIELVNNLITLVTDILKSPDFEHMYIQFEPETVGGVDYEVLNFYVDDSSTSTAIKHFTIKGYADATDNYTAMETKAGTKNQGTIEIAAYQGAADASFAAFIAAAINATSYAKMHTESGNAVQVDAIGVSIISLPVYANNAAALAGGLDVGYLYRTGADPDPVCIVH